MNTSNHQMRMMNFCKKATGLDTISAKMIRECADLILVSPCDLFNKSLLSGIFPDDWKCATVTPLFKQGEASDLNNYRPISAISVIATVFEKIVYEQLYNFLSNEDIMISTHQSGFHSLHSTYSTYNFTLLIRLKYLNVRPFVKK